MPITNTARNAMLAAIGVTHASLHGGFPGNAGAGEIAGGAPAYARRPIAFGAAAGGVRAQGADIVFDVPAGATVRYIGFWDAAAAGNFLGYHPLGNAPPREFVVDVAGDLIRSPAHGYAADDGIVFVGDAVPGGLVEGTVYFVRAPAADSFQVAAAAGGAAIDLTAQAGSACQIVRIVPEVFGSQGTLTVRNSQLSLLL